MSSSRIVVAIPSLNEERRIGDVIHQCLKHISEVWIINDGSVDRTEAVSRAAGARVISHAINRGKGMAIRTALEEFKKTDFDFLLLMDADGQHDPVHVPDFVKCAEKTRAEVVLGNRMGDAGKMPIVRRWTNRLMSKTVSWLSGTGIPDSQCGYRMVSRFFAEQFKPTTFRFDLESEMLIQAGRGGMKVESIPISTLYGGQGSHIQPLPDTLRFIRLIWKYLPVQKSDH